MFFFSPSPPTTLVELMPTPLFFNPPDSLDDPVFLFADKTPTSLAVPAVDFL
jgi:hypothetical protein